MSQTASPTRTATSRAAALRRAASVLRKAAAVLLLALPFALFLPSAHAQTPMDLGMTFTQQRSKFVGASASDFFYLRGATVDFADTAFHGLGPVVSLNGLAVTNLRTQIDIHQASFLGGGRYTYNLGHISPTIWNRKGSIFAEGVVGITLATAGEFPSGEHLVSNSSGFTYALGGGINYRIYHRFELRLMSHYFITDLPNGGVNQQKNIQVSAGVNWHLGN
jgi:hypothetical protein